MVDYLDLNHEVGTATSDCYLLYERRFTTNRYYYEPFPVDNQREVILRRNFVMDMTVERRELFARHGVFEESLSRCEDWDLSIRFLCGGERVGFVDEPLAYYRKRAASLSHDPIAISRGDLIVVQRALSRAEVRTVPRLSAVIRAWALQAAAIADYRTATRLWLRLAGHAGTSPMLRAKAVLAASAPRLAARVIHFREGSRRRARSRSLQRS